MSNVSKVWMRLPFPRTREVNDICEEFGVTLAQFMDHNPVDSGEYPAEFYWFVPVDQPGWVDEIALAAAQTIDKELSIDMPEATWAWRIATIQCRVNDAIQAAFYRQREEDKKAQ